MSARPPEDDARPGRSASRRAALLSIWLPFVIGTSGFIALALLVEGAPAWRIAAAVLVCTAANLAAVVRALSFGTIYGARDR